MPRLLLAVLALLIPVALSPSVASADEPKKEAAAAGKLVGSWKLVSAKYNGNEFTFPEGYTVVKHVTPFQFVTVIYNTKGELGRASGGSYDLEGEVYKETPEYGTSDNFADIKGKVQTFQCKVEGNKWTHSGQLSNGMQIEEVYEKVEKGK